MYDQIFRRKWVALGWAAMTLGSAYLFIPREGGKGPVDTAVRQIQAQQEARSQLLAPAAEESGRPGDWTEEPQLRDAPPEAARPKTAVTESETATEDTQAEDPGDVEVVERRSWIKGVPAPQE